jgi:predicted enzyme related to lactoylglutathione lyase
MVRAASRSGEVPRIFRISYLDATRSGRLRPFKQDNEYFPLAQKAMINLRVDDLDGVLDRLIDEGVTVDPKRESYDFGTFGWITDPAGNRVELWQPVATE